MINKRISDRLLKKIKLFLEVEKIKIKDEDKSKKLPKNIK